MSKNIKAYYVLAKPGIIYGNLITTAGGFLYGAIRHVSFGSLVAVLLGTGLVIASACVINNILDANMDKHMKRTKSRATVTGEISTRNAILYSVVLGLVGFAILLMFTNLLATAIGAVGLVSYAGVYTYLKSRTIHATLIGTIPGAVPPLAGYAAATGRLDTSAWLLFAILVFWQMVHFYAIAIFRRAEYKKAGVPIMSVVKGVWVTKIYMLVYGAAYLLALVALARFSYAGLLYLAIMIPLAIWWLIVLVAGLSVTDDIAWARKVFFMSLFMLPALSLALALNAWTP